MHYFRSWPYHKICEPLVQIASTSSLPSVASLMAVAISVSRLNNEMCANDFYRLVTCEVIVYKQGGIS
jgi:hypothetical protein